MSFIITAPIFLIIALGYATVRGGLVEKAAIAGMGRVVLYICVPAVIVRALINSDISAVLSPEYLIVYSAGNLLAYFALFAIFFFLLRRSLLESSLFGFAACMPNSIFIGYPVLKGLFDPVPITALPAALLVENLLLLPVALTMMEFGAAGASRPSKIAVQTLKNPVLIAIAVGFASSLLGLKPPPILAQVIDMFAATSGPLALFCVGGILVGASLKGRKLIVGLASAGKLFLAPALVALFIHLTTPFALDMQTAAIVLAASPTVGMYPLIGAKFGYGEETASILLAATVASFLSISAVLYLVA